MPFHTCVQLRPIPRVVYINDKIKRIGKSCKIGQSLIFTYSYIEEMITVMHKHLPCIYFIENW